MRPGATAPDRALLPVNAMRQTTTSTETINVNKTRPIANDLCCATDTFDVGSQTIVLGLIAPGGCSAATVESTSLYVLVDFPSSPSSSSTIATKASIRRAERRAPKLLCHQKAKPGRQRQK
jgi:hypothetical protein